MNSRNTIGCMLIFALSGCSATAASLQTAEMQSLVKGNNAFALDLYSRVRTGEGNLFFSPYSISTALAMTYAGARGETAVQMAGTLRFPLGQERLHQAFAELSKEFETPRGMQGYQVHLANSVWIDEEFRLLGSFIDLTKTHYGAAIELVDFRGAHEAARKKINDWVERKTRDKIKELIQPGVLDEMTRLVLANAIYFKGRWASSFKEGATRNEAFSVAPDRLVHVPMMSQKARFGYMEHERFQALALPYEGKELSMVVVLPRKTDGLAELEEFLTAERLDQWLGHMEEKEVMVYMPKFTMTSQFQLGRVLVSMGMSDAFSPGRADFSGIDGTRDLSISAVIHKAFVEVNEEGTEAAAATGVAMRLTAVPEAPPVFRADHPFIFLIRDNDSGSILFIGRVVHPKQ